MEGCEGGDKGVNEDKGNAGVVGMFLELWVTGILRIFFLFGFGF